MVKCLDQLAEPCQGFSSDDEPIFANHALALKAAGLAVLPARGQEPLRDGFNRWKCAPGFPAVEEWAARDPTADIVYVPGLSRPGKHRRGLVVVDADNAIEVERVVELFGDTPAKVDTRRGRHFIYASDGTNLGSCTWLRKCGFEIDIKWGQRGDGIVVAPPSRHAKQRDFHYRWAPGSGIEALADLPTFNVKALKRIEGHLGIGSDSLPNVTKLPPPGETSASNGPRQGYATAPVGERGVTLNKYLCSQVGYCDGFDDLLDVARTWNASLADHGSTPLETDAEVVKRARAVWRDYEASKIQRQYRQRATAKASGEEVRDELLSDSAFRLLMLVRSEHGARHARGEPFALSIRAMVEHRVLGSWAKERYAKARDELLHKGYIVCVKDHTRRTPALFRLVDRSRR